MKNVYLFCILITSWLSLGTTRAQGQCAIKPAGADLATAIDIGSTAACSVYYTDTKSNDPANCFGNDYGQGSDDIFYRFTLQFSAAVDISLCGSTFDTYLTLLNGSGGLVMSNDDNGPLCPGLKSSAHQVLGPGTYYIVVEGWSGSVGNIKTEISIDQSKAGSTMVGAQKCNPINFGTLGTCGQISTVDTRNTIAYGNDYGQPSNDIFYQFTIPNKTQVSLSTCESDFDSYLYLLDSGGNLISSNNDYGPACANNRASLTQTLEAGTYYVAVESYVVEGLPLQDGNATLRITTALLPLTISTNNTSINAGGTATLTVVAPGASSYSWATAAGQAVATTATASVQPTATTTYTVTVRYADGCTQTQTVTVTVLTSQNQNYILTNTIRQTGITTTAQIDNLAPGQRQQQITYLDGLGRTTQQIQVQASPSQLDLVTPVTYDALGRSPMAYLPYAGAMARDIDKTPLPHGDVLTQQAAFYQQGGDRVANDTAPWAVKEYEASPLNRVLRQGGPGATWQPDATAAWNSSDHTSKQRFRANIAREVRLWECGTAPRSVTSPGFYGAGQLNVLETKDENGHLTVEYQDKSGHVLVKKVQEASSITSTTDAGFLVTQYVYDDFGRLRLVIQPEGTRHLPQPAGAGKLLQEVWLNTTPTGTMRVQDIPLGTVPSNVSTLPTFEAPTNPTDPANPINVDNYGQRVRGYVTAPVDGYYTFWISSDDTSELWLSTSEDPSQKQLIASEPVWTNPRTWNWHASQQSKPIWLISGQRYYIEALQKEGVGGDNLAVGWQIPGGQLDAERPIPGSRLSTEALNLSPVSAAAFLDTWCFRYEYDGRGRVIEKQVPAAGAVRFVYNQRDDVVGTQDARQANASAKPWLITKYDALRRPIATAIVNMGQDRAGFQAALDQQASTTPLFENRSSAAEGYTLSQSYPAVSVDDVRTLTYYDDYAYPAFNSFNFKAEAGVTTDQQSVSVRGQVTGTRVRVDETSTFLTNVMYYDVRNRPLQTIATNHLGGQDRVTLNYGAFLDTQPRSSLTTHRESTAQKHSIAQRMSYDHVGRLLNQWQSLDGEAEVLLASNEYNELGQLVDKKLHSTDVAATTFLQSVDYRYNVRGWLTNINDRALSNDGSSFNDADPNADDLLITKPDLFGMELMYDKNPNLRFGLAQYNGNISEVIWNTRNQTDQTKTRRGYGYEYDNVGRLTNGHYRAWDGTNWSAEYSFYSVSNLAYDANGNIKSLLRRGMLTGSLDDKTLPRTYGVTDDLTYSYDKDGDKISDGNRLLGVDDALTAATVAPNDFEENGQKYTPSPTGETKYHEYQYDENGNLTLDKNKGITGIDYNVLNLPIAIRFATGNHLEYSYTATGTKLEQRVFAVGVTDAIKTVDYTGGFVYEKQVPVFVQTAEGRALYSPTSTGNKWDYEYHLKDHLGNLRVAFRNTIQTRLLTSDNASQEEGNAPKFTYGAARRVSSPTLNKSTYAISLASTGSTMNASTGGPSNSLAVSQNDRLEVEVYYITPAGPMLNATGPTTPVYQVAPVTTLSVAPTLVRPLARDNRGSEAYQRTPALGIQLSLTGALTALVSSNSLSRQQAATTTGTTPQPLGQKYAFVAWQLYDNANNRVGTEHHELISDYDPDKGWRRFTFSLSVDFAAAASKEGYVKIQLMNEGSSAVYFDDFSIRQPQLLVQENHYDPWGSNLAGIEQAGNPNSKVQYNSKEKQEESGLNWLDYGARMYDPQLGKWHVVDQLAMKYASVSPYTFVDNNPVRLVDVEGKDIGIYDINTKKNIAYHPNQAPPEGASDFVKQTFISLDYKFRTGSENTRKIISSLSTDTNIQLKIKQTETFGSGETAYQPVNQKVSFNLKEGLLTGRDPGSSGRISPATGLFHELTHAYEHLQLINSTKAAKGTANEQSTQDALDTFEIEGTASEEYATSMEGESVNGTAETARKNYDDHRGPYKTTGPISITADQLTPQEQAMFRRILENSIKARKQE
jgi:RHS repeat-associated protein